MANEFMHEHEHWLYFAQDDLEGAKDLVKLDRLRIAMYLTQQSAEKAFKAYLCFHEREIVKIHDLAKLMSRCAQLEPTFKQFVAHCETLNAYISRSRYPDDCLFIPDEESAAEAIQMAQEIFDFVKAKIKP